ncbi:unnamed protein product [Arctogadus glacialis]
MSDSVPSLTKPGGQGPGAPLGLPKVVPGCAELKQLSFGLGRAAGGPGAPHLHWHRGKGPPICTGTGARGPPSALAQGPGAPHLHWHRGKGPPICTGTGARGPPSALAQGPGAPHLHWHRGQGPPICTGTGARGP